MSKKLENQAKKYFSETRLYRYSDQDNTLDAYFINLIVSEKLLYMISIFEVIFRNKIHMILVEKHGDNCLYEKKVPLHNNKEKELVYRCIKDANKTKLKIKESMVLAELTIGFWCLFSQNFKRWPNGIDNIHPNNSGVKFKAFKKRVKLISEIRNKVAHHERIIKKRPYNINDVLNAIILETLLLIDNSDSDFKEYIMTQMYAESSDIQKLVKKIK